VHRDHRRAGAVRAPVIPAVCFGCPLHLWCAMIASLDLCSVRNLTLREQVLAHLREEILSSRLEPGAELNEVALATSLGVSRGPIREALGRLVAEGFVTVTLRRGAIVTKLTKQK